MSVPPVRRWEGPIHRRDIRGISPQMVSHISVGVIHHAEDSAAPGALNARGEYVVLVWCLGDKSHG